MGNGFPIGGLLIHEKIEAQHGLLGTTFGGNHLACAAALAVIKTIENENLIQRAGEMGTYFINRLKEIEMIREIRGLGLMIGIEFEMDIKTIRDKLLFEKHIFTGYSGSKTIRLLPPITIGKSQIDYFILSVKEVLLQNA